MHTIVACEAAAAASTLAVVGDVLYFGGASGTVRCVRWTAPLDDASSVILSPMSETVAVSDSSVDCLVALPECSGKEVLVALTNGVQVQQLHRTSGTGKWKKGPLVRLPDECEYTNRSSAHCWLDGDHALIGCFNGAVVCCSFAEHASGEPSAWVVALEDSPVVGLQYVSLSKQLIVSTLRRSTLARGVDILGLRNEEGQLIALTQIGSKARSEGCYGACYFHTVDKVYAARHNCRVFEADPGSGSVFQTFKVADDTPLGLVRPLRLEGVQTDDEVVLWSEGQTFCAVVILSTTQSECLWRCDVSGDEEVFTCTAASPHFQFALTSLGRVLIAPFDDLVDTSFVVASHPPATAAPTHAPLTHHLGQREDDVPQQREDDKPHRQEGSAPNFLVDGQPVVKPVVVKTRKVSIIKKVSVVKKKVPKKEGSPTDVAEHSPTAAGVESTRQKSPSPIQEGVNDATPSHEEAPANREVCGTEDLSPPPTSEPVGERREAFAAPSDAFTPGTSAATAISSTAEEGAAAHESCADAGDHQESYAPPISEQEGHTTSDSGEPVEDSNRAQDPSQPPEDFKVYQDDLTKLYRTYCARQLDKKAQPLLLREIVALIDVTRKRLEDRVSSPRRHQYLSEYAALYFASEAATTPLVILLRAAIEWSLHLAVKLSDEERCANVKSAYEVLCELPLFDPSDRVEVDEAIVSALGKYEGEHDWLQDLSADAVDTMFHSSSVLKRFHSSQKAGCTTPTAATSSSQSAKKLCPIERFLCMADVNVVPELGFCPAPTCSTRQYFAYLFAVFPSKALQVALANYPALNVRFLEWAMSGEVQTACVETLKQNNCNVDRMTSDDLFDSLTEILLLVAQEHTAAIQESACCFPRAMSIFLKRRLQLLDATLPTALPAATRQKKVRRIEQAILSLIRSCPLNVSIAHPSMGSLFCQYDFPAGVVEIRGVEAAIHDSVHQGRIDKLLSLFRLASITDSHWMLLFASSHAANKLQEAVYLSLSVLQQPNRARLLLRRAFPYIDTPELADEQLQSVVSKLGMLLGTQAVQQRSEGM